MSLDTTDYLPLNENIVILNNTNTGTTDKCGILVNRNFNNSGETDFFHKSYFENNGFNCLHIKEGSEIDDIYNKMVLRIDTGVGKNQTRNIVKYEASSKKILLDKDLNIAISKNDHFTIFNEKYVGLVYDGPSDEFICSTFDDGKSTVIKTKNFHCKNGRFDADVTAASLSTFSDIRLKKNIKNLNYNDANDTIKKLQAVEFEWDSKKFNNLKNGKQFGLIAQDVETIIPNIVNNKQHYKSVEYDKIVPFLIETIKGLSLRVDELEKKLNDI